MNLGLAGRRAFVGGASQGLGFAVAEALVAEGVALAARDPLELDAAKARLYQAIVISADLAHAAYIAKMSEPMVS